MPMYPLYERVNKIRDLTDNGPRKKQSLRQN